MTEEILLFASTVIWLTSLLLPYLLFIAGNRFKTFILTALRSVIAILGGWAYVVAYAVASNAMNIAKAYSNQGSNFEIKGDGSALSFSVMFGWVLPVFIVCLAWIVHSRILPKFNRKKKIKWG